MLRNYMGIINLEEDEKDIRSLTGIRPIGTVPVAGRYRVIDFMLSNMVNAGITSISVFSNKFTRSLDDHLSSGKPWDLDRKNDGLFLFQHNLLGGNSGYDLEQFENSINFLSRSDGENVILASSYMLCNMDLEQAVEHFEKTGADITVVYKKINNADESFNGCDILKINEEGRVVKTVKNIGIETDADISMEIFVMKKSLLLEFMYEAAKKGIKNDFKRFVYNNVMRYNVTAFEFKGYVRCINSIKSYYETNMEMLDIATVGELFSKNNPVYTKTKDCPPTKYLEGSDVKHSLVAEGAVIKGKVKTCVISRNAVIEEGAELEGCIILQNVHIGKNARLKNVIVDKGVIVKDEMKAECPKDYPLVLEKKKY